MDQESQNGTEAREDDGEPRDAPWTPDGYVRIMADRCTTCIFRPGNLMGLRPGRVKGMVDAVIREESHITCHDTYSYKAGGLPPALCRGMEQHPQAGLRSLLLRLAAGVNRAIVLVHADGREERVSYTRIPSPYTEGGRPAATDPATPTE